MIHQTVYIFLINNEVIREFYDVKKKKKNKSCLVYY